MAFYSDSPESTKIYATNLRYAAKLRGISQIELAEAVDSVKQSVNGWFQAYRMPNPTYMDKIAEVLRFPVSAFFDENGRCGLDRATEVTLPYVSEDGVVSLASDNNLRVPILPSMQDTVNNVSAFLFTVPDDTMSPKFLQGDVLICRHANTAPNGTYVITLIDGKTAVRQYNTSQDGALVFFLPTNPSDKTVTDAWSANDPNKPKIIGIPFSLQREV